MSYPRLACLFAQTIGISINIPAVQRLRAAGAEVRQGSLSSLKWDDARQYHVIIALAANPDEAQSVNTLEHFVRSGGGLLFFWRFYGAERANAYLKAFDASMPWELIQDASHTFHPASGLNIPYAFTENINTHHPVTLGVKGIWYSVQDKFLSHTSPVTVSDAWSVLVRTSNDAKSLLVGDPNDHHLRQDGEITRAPPIVAAREYGSGAIVLVGISPTIMFYGQGLAEYQNIDMENGDGMQPSDLRRLYENALVWLAQHGRKGIQLGQGELKPQENSWARVSIPDWNQGANGRDWCTNPAHGVIGAHSTLSDGHATPQALIAKAGKLGLNWIAFTERLENFSPSKWAQLRSIC